MNVLTPHAPAGSAEAAIAAARALQRATGAPVSQRQLRSGPAGTTLARVLLAHSIAKSRDRFVGDIAREVFRGNDAVAAVARASVGAADTTTAGWAAELVRTETRALLDEIRPLSAFAGLAALGLSTTFDGATSVVVPNLAVGSAVGGGWVGEGGAIPVVKGAVTSKRLKRFKLAGIVPITKELQAASSPEAVALMRELLKGFLANLLDQSMLDAGPDVVGVRPAGLLNGVTTAAGATGGGLEALTADLKTFAAAFLAAA